MLVKYPEMFYLFLELSYYINNYLASLKSAIMPVGQKGNFRSHKKTKNCLEG